MEMTNLAKELKAAMEASASTASDVAKSTKLHRSLISRALRGRGGITITNLRKLCRFFDNRTQAMLLAAYLQDQLSAKEAKVVMVVVHD
jgi:transcriptional regulator with XRE-family HTH domain